MSQPRPTEDVPLEEQGAMPPLKTYLSRMRSLVFPKTSALANADRSSLQSKFTKETVLVLGNPSADLDSFISAVATAYFYSLQSNSKHSNGKTYIPILNLPAIKARDLWRLRPEYGVAIRLAMGESASKVSQGEAGSQGKTPLLEQLITIADIKGDEGSPLHHIFASSQALQSHQPSEERKQPLFLVDHNAPSIPGLSEDVISTCFSLQGCIDHHGDERVIPKDANPRIITTGIGSCTSLVVQHLRDQGMWPPSPSSSTISTQNPLALETLSALALAPILIDTNNLKATGEKCSNIDRAVVKFLESNIISTALTTTSNDPSTSAGKWDRSSFYKAINTAKSNSLDLLTMPEILDRDFKAWDEAPTTSTNTAASTAIPGEKTEIAVGISSLVKPLSWLIKHAGGIDSFIASLEAFAADEERKLSVLCLLTRTGDGRKEILVLGFGNVGKAVVKKFEAVGAEELKLERWEEDQALMEGLEGRFRGDGKGGWKILYMGDTNKTRKQVAPLLRECVRKI